MDLSIVIVSTDEAHYLRPCLTALRPELDSLQAEVLVVDNLCTDETAALTQELLPDHATVISSPRRNGFARSNNLALRQAQGRHCLLLNPDTEARPGSLLTLVHYLDDHPQVGIVGARLVNPDGSLQPSCRAFPTPWSVLARARTSQPGRAVRHYLMLDWDHADARSVDWVIGACLGAPRRALEQVGLLDEGFFLYYEDTDWCYRMWQAGWEVHYLPEATVMHHYQRAGAESPFRRAARIQMRSALRLFLKHGRLRSRLG